MSTKRIVPFLMLIPAFFSIAAGDAKHGEYIVKNVAMCMECHTPRTESGTLIESDNLHGAPIPVSAPSWAKSWALRSMNIAGLTKWTHEESVEFLKTGMRPDGTRALLPMPQYRMSQQDAEDVVAYLKNIPAE